MASEPATHKLHGFVTHPQRRKEHPISRPKRSKRTPKKGLTSLLKPYYKIETLIKLRLFSFVARGSAKHKLYSFVSHPQRQNSNLISCPKRSKRKPEKGLTSLLKPYYKIYKIDFSVLWPASMPSTSCITL